MGRVLLSASGLAKNVTDEDVYNALQCPAPHPSTTTSAVDYSPYQVYRKSDMPRRFHYTNSRRLEPTIMTMKAGHTVFQSTESDNYCQGGDHGYDNLYPNMQVLLLLSSINFSPNIPMNFKVNVKSLNHF